LLDNPKEALGQLGVQVPEEVEVKVVEEPARVVYLVLPVNPEEQLLVDEQLDSVAGGGYNNFQVPPQCGVDCPAVQCPMRCETWMKI